MAGLTTYHGKPLEMMDWRVTFGNIRKETTTTLWVRAKIAGTAKKIAKSEALRLGIKGRISDVRVGIRLDD